MQSAAPAECGLVAKYRPYRAMSSQITVFLHLRSRDERNHGLELGSYAVTTGAQRRWSDMLVLSRKLGEKIYIGENICITVVDIDRGKIRLGIEAPRDVPIYRQELLPLQGQQAKEQPVPVPVQKLPSAS